VVRENQGQCSRRKEREEMRKQKGGTEEKEVRGKRKKAKKTEKGN
jgi:hypothetical protein